MDIVFIIGIAQGLFFSLFLFTQKSNLIANRLLIIWLMFICFSLFLNYLYISKLIESCPHLIGLDTALPFLYGPLLYLYCKYLSSSSQHFHKNDYWHFAVFAFYFVYVGVNFYSQSGAYKLHFLQQIHSGHLPFDLTIAIYLKFIQASIYLYFSLLLMKKHKISIADFFSETQKVNLSWLQTITFSIACIYFVKLLGISLPFIGFAINLGATEAISDLFVILFVFVIAFKGYHQQEIFKTQYKPEPISTQAPELEISEIEVEIITKYANSKLTKEESMELFAKLEHFMQTTKPFLQPNITLSEIAIELSISLKILSQIINEQANNNFFNYINEYRIKEVKLRLVDEKYKHLTILGIALECGFNSKSAFNNVFKKLTNQTPSEYLKSIS